ncbi:MAG: hypothetical protein OXO49_03440 [Gammaproteobacteria bacterium]|nr:hypothetical protein [Gammaproteobacteria bacterium]MDE0252034.1 hypothetical protein [Gammaproteobacteria bacterium]
MNKTATKFLYLLAASLTTLIIFVVAVVVLRTPSTPPETNEDTTLSAIPQAMHTVSMDQVEPPFIEQYASAHHDLTIEDLIEECPEPFVWGYDGFGVLSNQCVSMLEPFFIDLPYIPQDGFQWLSFPDRITYRRILEDPLKDRELVFDALSRAECRFEDGEVVRPDLRESCHAESFYVYSSFIHVCDWYQDSRNLRDNYDLYDSGDVNHPTAQLWERHIKEIATGADGNLNTAQYSRLKQDVWHTALATHWYRRKCKEYDLSSIVLGSDKQDLEYLNLLSSIATRLGIYPEIGGEHSGGNFDPNVYHVFSVIAAYFGDYSASLLYPQRRVGSSLWSGIFVDSTLVSATRELHPWMEHFSDTTNLSTYGTLGGDLPNHGAIWGDLEYNKDFVHFVDGSIKGLLALDEAGVEYDFAALVDHLCRRLTKHEKDESNRDLSCQVAVDELNAEKNVSFQKGLKLDEFKKIALELGVWN